MITFSKLTENGLTYVQPLPMSKLPEKGWRHALSAHLRSLFTQVK
jgi:hypothetical protein